jgi:hypothetical protein
MDNCWSYVFFRCNASGKLWNGEGLASLYVLWQFDQVHMFCTKVWHVSPCGVSSIGELYYSTFKHHFKLIFAHQLPNKVKDVIHKLPWISKSGIAALHTHCRHELFHACWDTLLDKYFLLAYHHGIVLKCTDGVFRRIFPHIFTYSADYPEKCIL